MYQPEKEQADVASSTRDLFAEIESGRAYAVVSSIVIGELLDGSFDLLLSRFDGRKGEIVDAPRPVMELARKIRNRFQRQSTKSSSKALDLVDCIHLATAHQYGCDVFVTTDGHGNGRHSILSCSAAIEKEYRMKVCTPMDAVDQRSLDLGTSPPNEQPKEEEEE
jgi:predicted nucleic acid-binding protein